MLVLVVNDVEASWQALVEAARFRDAEADPGILVIDSALQGKEGNLIFRRMHMHVKHPS